MIKTGVPQNNVGEVEANLKTIGGDMLKIEYLENCIKNNVPNDVRRFCHLKLADLYSRKSMNSQAARNLQGAADCATTYNDKMQLYLSETVMRIKTGDYNVAEESFKKALICGNEKQKSEMKEQIKKEYLNAAETFEKQNKNNNAIKAYEKMKSLAFVSADEKTKINEKLAKLYARVGKVREAIQLEHAPTYVPEQKPEKKGPDIRGIFEELGL